MMRNNQLTDKRIAEILERAEICDDSVLTDYADIAAAMRELQQYRKASAKPFGYYSAETPAILEKQGYASISADPLVDSNKPLYAAPQPAPGYATAMKVNLSEADSEKLIAELQKVNIEPSSLSLPVPSDWISCSERLPEKECDVLAIWNGSMEVLHLDDMVGLWDDGDFNSRIPLEDVTHWMPLPQGPF